MPYGRYFKLDPEASFIERGIAVFRYKTDNRIYLTFTPDSFEFFTVYDVITPGMDGAEKTKQGLNHLILRVLLDENLEKGRLSTDTGDFDKNIAASANKSPAVTYSNTFHFDETKMRNRRESVVTTPPESRPPEEFPTRNLILDFLFDLQETRVFEISPHYEGLVQKFRGNFFARCLLAKAHYCYQRAFYKNILKETRAGEQTASTQSSRRKRREFYGEDCFKAEQEWTECIRDPRADRIFYDSNGWFESSETEMKRVYHPWLPIALGKRWKKEKAGNDKLASKWFVMRYVWFFPFMMAVSHPSFRGMHLLMPRLLFTIGAAWFPLLFIQTPKVEHYNAHKAFFIGFTLVSILASSWIMIRRVLSGFAQNVFWRTTGLSLLMLVYASLLGLIIRPKVPNIEEHFIFFCGAAAFTGVVINILLSDKKPSESL